MAIPMRARCYYWVPDGGARANKEAVLGLVLVGGDRSLVVFSRREPEAKAKLIIRNAYSIDHRAVEHWPDDNVQAIQFILGGKKGDPNTPCITITREEWLAHQTPESHGAGWQRYVGESRFQRHDRVVYDDSDRTEERVTLGREPPTSWQKIAPPQAPAPRRPRGVLPGQGELFAA